ncbi:MAG: competence protein ComEA [Actinobacteria bacterium HGW-Actinobacteria-4]|nr:MAG: competence protein ComEA [Actinobacteria bacterium HGW-Actinobacteria-4]
MSDATDAVSARWREGLTRSAARAYEAAHGNPIPEQRRGSRWKVEPRLAVTLALVVGLLSIMTYWSLRPTPVAPVPLAVVPSVGSVTSDVVVHVAGAVHQPGLVTLNTGARVADAVDVAGGMTASADTSSVNLARTLVDGEQIYVPEVGEALESGKINLNRAGPTELEALPGIGPALAARIVADRETNGPFATVSELSRVSGVGPAVVEKIASLATV